ncbi:MAG: hypothetical protein AB1726_00550 [Planctomycetota bacterium]
MDEAIDFRALVALEPALAELEADVRAVRDDGTAPFFCSNYEWLPLDGRLKTLVGTDRRRFRPRAGEPPVLHDGRAYEVAYLALSRLLPPCRACGCRRFHAWRAEEAEEARRRR